MAMGNNGAAVKDIGSIDENIANITAISTASLAIGYTKYLYDSELSMQRLILVLPIKPSAIGISLQRYGIEAYHEITAGVAFAKQFGQHLAIGIKANYHQLAISNYGSTNTFSVDVGINYNINSKLNFGFYVLNPSSQQFEKINSRLPSVLSIGGAYQISDKVLLAGALAKSLNGKINTHFGLDYQLLNAFSLRGGLSTKPFKQYAGFGFSLKHLIIDTAISNDINLGLTPQIALAYAF